MASDSPAAGYWYTNLCFFGGIAWLNKY